MKGRDDEKWVKDKIIKEIKGAKKKERQDSMKWKEVKTIIQSSFLIPSFSFPFVII